jgi:hypothetical protein
MSVTNLAIQVIQPAINGGSSSRAALSHLQAARDNAVMQTEPPNPDPPKRKRRWFQFSLRALFVSVTLMAALCPFGVRLLQQWERDREIEEIDELLRQWSAWDTSRIESVDPLRSERLRLLLMSDDDATSRKRSRFGSRPGERSLNSTPAAGE